LKLPVYITSANLDIWEYIEKYSCVFILTDSNTCNYCLPILSKHQDWNINIITLPAGENFKNLEACGYIWERLSMMKADRQSLLVNLGGGMVSDIGGFAASTYKRGIDFINIPTSLLAMVDAGIGGKTGINFLKYKNQVGSFAEAEEVLIYPAFLETLSSRELLSGFAEVLKYGLIADKNLWENCKKMPVNAQELIGIIKQCVDIKLSITNADPFEKAERKLLNFGHTVGHALESFSMINHQDPILHGEAVALGMIVEGFLSVSKTGLGESIFKEIRDRINENFPIYIFERFDIPEIIELTLQDKKNKNHSLQLVLLESIGKAVYDIECSIEEVTAALKYICNG
jgi:3-dehydroquinate synthase